MFLKNIHKILFYSGGLFIFFALFSGSIGSFIFDKLADNAADKYVIRKSSVDSMDAKIDNAFYLVKQLDLKIEKLKTFFSQDKPDESKYQRTENHIVKTSLYDTISSVFRVIFIVIFYIAGFFLILTGIILKLVNRNLTLRNRIEKLENVVFRNNNLSSDLLIIENAD